MSLTASIKSVPSGAPARTHRITLVRLLAVVVCLAVPLTVAAPAHADTGYGYCWQASCNGMDPIYENCQVNATTVSSVSYTYSNGTRYEVDLRYSPDCEANWARVVTSTSRPFCIRNSVGNVDRYTSAPNVASWTNMINGAPNVHDTAYLSLPSPTESLGNQALFASDQPSSWPVASGQPNYPC
jgi:hypothetical protein